MIEYFGVKSLFLNALQGKWGEGGVPPQNAIFEARYRRQAPSQPTDQTVGASETTSAE
jgi:hypothetical protein